MSGTELRNRATQAVNKAGPWANVGYKIFMVVISSLILMAVNGGKKIVVNAYDDFEQLKKDRDDDKAAHVLINSKWEAQDKFNTDISDSIITLQGTVEATEEKIEEIDKKLLTQRK